MGPMAGKTRSATRNRPAGRSQVRGELPSTWRSYAPIAVPILLISAQSVAKLALPEDSIVVSALQYIGWPVVALTIRIVLAYLNIRTLDDKEKARAKWVEDGLRASAMILVVTGLGGSLSEILRGTPAVDYIADLFAS